VQNWFGILCKSCKNVGNGVIGFWNELLLIMTRPFENLS
jgi:hypothetical protein